MSRGWRVGLVVVVAGLAYATIGYWPYTAIGPASFFTTADELYLGEWLTWAVFAHQFPTTLPYGTTFHNAMATWMSLVVNVVPNALTIEHFTSWVRMGNGLLWLCFGMYLSAGAGRVRELWIALALINPVVLFAAFGYAKPDFLMYALATVAALHWTRAQTTDDKYALWIAAAVFGAAVATKPSVLIVTAPWYAATMRWPESVRAWGRLLVAAAVSVGVCVIVCPQYLELSATVGSLVRESQLVRSGFPGTRVYPPPYWLLALALSFPVEVLLFLFTAYTRRGFPRRSALAWLVLFVLYAISVRRFMPTYLLPLMALVAGTGLATTDEAGWHPVLDRAALGVAVAFTVMCLIPKIDLVQRFPTRTSYGQASRFIIAEGLRPVPLSEIGFRPEDAGRVAHFWTPKTMASLRKDIASPHGVYVVSDDSLIKASITPSPMALSNLGPEYLSLINPFLASSGSHAVFALRYPPDAEQRFFEIHSGGYWPWRHVLALIRREQVSPGTSVVIYKF